MSERERTDEDRIRIIENAEAKIHELRARVEAAEDFRAEIVVDAFTAPDADWNTILDSLRSRIRDQLAHVEALEGRLSQYERGLNLTDEEMDAVALRGRVEALEGALRQASECCARPAGVCFDRAALAGEPTDDDLYRAKVGELMDRADAGESEPPTTCPTCAGSGHRWDHEPCDDTWHTVPTGTTQHTFPVKPDASLDDHTHVSGVPTGTDP